MANETVIKRDPRNPILTPEKVGGNVDAIHNSAIIRFKGKYVGLFRIDDQGLREGIYKGVSDDGIEWKIDKQWIKATSAYPEIDDVIRLGFDPRITCIDGVYYVTYCFWYANHQSTMSLLRTHDFETFEHIGFPLPPQNRNGVLFPRKINGKFVMLHRPSGGGDGDIYVSASPDLVHWGEHRVVMVRGGGIGWLKVGPGPAPIEVDEGWLMLFHAVRNTCSGSIYCMSGAILDRDNPHKVLHRCVRYLLHPTEDYERIGDVFNVVFPTSAILDDSGENVDIYYGCADTRVSLAHARVRDIVDFVIQNRAGSDKF